MSVKNNTSAIPPKPTAEVIRHYLGKWEDLKNYKLQEDSIKLLLAAYPHNTNVEHVLLKVCVLNTFYSTNIYDCYSVAQHIASKKIDDRLKANDTTLVNDIAAVVIANKAKNFYSFATKYCSHHQPLHFAIYDSFVDKMLWHYQKQDQFMVFRRTDLKIYPIFIEVVKQFRVFYGLHQFTLKEIDAFLWIAGKKYFPATYARKTLL